VGRRKINGVQSNALKKSEPVRPLGASDAQGKDRRERCQKPGNELTRSKNELKEQVCLRSAGGRGRGGHSLKSSKSRSLFKQ